MTELHKVMKKYLETNNCYPGNKFWEKQISDAIKIDEQEMNQIIKKADDFVTIIKEAQKKIQKVVLSSDLDFVGCGHYYVVEKLNSLINTAKFYRDAIKSIHKKQNGG